MKLYIRSILRKGFVRLLPPCDAEDCNRNATGDAPAGRIMCEKHAQRAWELDGGGML